MPFATLFVYNVAGCTVFLIHRAIRIEVFHHDQSHHARLKAHRCIPPDHPDYGYKPDKLIHPDREILPSHRVVVGCRRHTCDTTHSSADPMPEIIRTPDRDVGDASGDLWLRFHAHSLVQYEMILSGGHDSNRK